MRRVLRAVHEDSSDTITSRTRSPFKFLLLVFALSLPFWLAGALTTLQLLPGLPVSSLMFLCPATAALILVNKENKSTGVTELLKRCFDCKRIRAKIWYIPMILVMPGVMVFSYVLTRLTGVALPAPQFTVLAALALFLAFFIAALGEELGWSGYAIDPMQDRWGALPAGVLLGFVWSAWHIVPYLQAHRSPAWIAWKCLFTVAVRVLLVWIYNNAGKSVFAATLFHTMGNVSVFLFPTYGSYYDPRIAGLITTFAAVLVTVVWGPRSLARYRTA
jgi:uncharacterized protein